MDRQEFRKRVLLEHLTSPWVLGPLAAGLTTLAVAWGLDLGAGLPSFLGLSAVLGGVGALLTRWFLKSDDIAGEVFEQMTSAEKKGHEAQLDALDRRLQGDGDERTEEALRHLRDMFADYQGDRSLIEKLGIEAAVDVDRRLDKLFTETVRSLERSYELWQASTKMRTHKGREDLVTARERVLEEIEENVKHAARAIDGLRAMQLNHRDDEKLAKLRQELDDTLQIAQRVEDRLYRLEEDLEVGEAADSGPLERE